MTGRPLPMSCFHSLPHGFDNHQWSPLPIHMFLFPLAGDMFIQTRLSVAHVPKTHTVQMMVDALVSTASCGHEPAQHDSVLNLGRTDISKRQVELLNPQVTDMLLQDMSTCYSLLLGSCRVSGCSLVVCVWSYIMLRCTRIASMFYTICSSACNL